jgi:IS605 OrfB family transposase
MPSNLDFKQIKELRIIPRNNCFYLELVYKVAEEKMSLWPDQVLGIDHGLNNWLTCVSNVGTSLIVDGLHLKSMNNWYNKQVASIKEKKPKGFWSQKLSRITEKRNRQVRDGVNKAARIVINHCLEHKIGTIIFGWNEGQKKGAKMGRKTNQRFVQIPTGRLKERIKQLASRYGIRFIETEESYTSIASFLDGDFLPKYGEKPQEWKSSGRRVKRGLFRSQKNHYLNADANGASNIIRKVSTKLRILRNVSLDGVSMGSLTAPQRIKIWSAKKTLRNADLSRCVVSA